MILGVKRLTNKFFQVTSKMTVILGVKRLTNKFCQVTSKMTVILGVKQLTHKFCQLTSKMTVILGVKQITNKFCQVTSKMTVILGVKRLTNKFCEVTSKMTVILGEKQLTHKFYQVTFKMTDDSQDPNFKYFWSMKLTYSTDGACFLFFSFSSRWVFFSLRIISFLGYNFLLTLYSVSSFLLNISFTFFFSLTLEVQFSFPAESF